MSTRIRTTTPAVSEGPTPEQTLETLITDYFKANNEKKKAESNAEKTRKALYKHMKDKGIGNTTVGTDIKLIAEIGRSSIVTIDVEKLESLVGAKKVKPFLSITKGIVEEKFGTEIAEECTIKTEGNENVTVKVA